MTLSFAVDHTAMLAEFQSGEERFVWASMNATRPRSSSPEDTGRAVDDTPDALIDSDGERIQLEVVRNVDQRYAKLQDAFEKLGSQFLSIDHKGWLVTVTHDARAKTLHDQLP